MKYTNTLYLTTLLLSIFSYQSTVCMFTMENLYNTWNNTITNANNYMYGTAEENYKKIISDIKLLNSGKPVTNECEKISSSTYYFFLHNTQYRNTIFHQIEKNDETLIHLATNNIPLLKVQQPDIQTICVLFCTMQRIKLLQHVQNRALETLHRNIQAEPTFSSLLQSMDTLNNYLFNGPDETSLDAKELTKHIKQFTQDYKVTSKEFHDLQIKILCPNLKTPTNNPTNTNSPAATLTSQPSAPSNNQTTGQNDNNTNNIRLATPNQSIIHYWITTLSHHPKTILGTLITTVSLGCYGTYKYLHRSDIIENDIECNDSDFYDDTEFDD